MAQLVLEGTWEEIERQSEQLAGKRVRLMVLSDEDTNLSTPDRPLYETASPEEFQKAFDALAECYRHLPVLPPEAYSRDSLYEGHY
jgi:hypothetical protein